MNRDDNIPVAPCDEPEWMAREGRESGDYPDDDLPTFADHVPQPDGYAIWREEWERQHGGLSQAEAESAERFWSEC